MARRLRRANRPRREKPARPILTIPEFGARMWPDLTRLAAYKRGYRAVKSGALPAHIVVRLNGRATGILRAPLEEWLAGRGNGDGGRP